MDLSIFLDTMVVDFSPCWDNKEALRKSLTYVSDITQDSRKVQKKSIFVAHKGTAMDGIHFIRDALDNGAALCIVDQQEYYQKFKDQYPLLLVHSSRKAYGLLATLWFSHPSKKIKDVIGVTGTNGKTSTTFFIRQLAELLGLKAATLGTLGYFCGDTFYPSSLTTEEPMNLQKLLALAAQHNVDVFSMEVSSIALDQDRIYGTSFSKAIFTNCTHDHLDYHKTFEHYLNSKYKLFNEYQPTFSIINIDDPYGKALADMVQKRGQKCITTSTKTQKAHLFATPSRRHPYKGHYDLHLCLSHPLRQKEIIPFFFPLRGEFNLSNVLGALCVFMLEGVSPTTLLPLVSQLKPPRGRLEEVVSVPYRVFIDYAHTPDALERVLDVLYKEKKGRLICVFGCGGNRDKEKRPEMGRVASNLSDILILTSDNPRDEDPESILMDIRSGINFSQAIDIFLITDRKEAIGKALGIAQEDDSILIAGKGHETTQETAGQKIYLSDHEIVQDYIASTK